MDNICGNYDVLTDNMVTGTVKITHEKLKYIINCRSTYKTEKIMRLFCLSQNKYITIGVLFPDENGLYLNRKFSKFEFEQKGISKIEHFITSDSVEPQYLKTPESEAENTASQKLYEAIVANITPETVTAKNLSFSDEKNDTYTKRQNISWKAEPSPASLFSDKELIESCSRLHGAMKYTDGEYTYLAVPASPDRPFPMMPVFCFGSFESISGAPYIVFKIKNGNLC